MRNDSKETTNSMEFGLQCFDITLNAVAFLLNAAALFVFIKSKTSISNSGIRILIITEMGLCFSRFNAGCLFFLEKPSWVYFFTLGNAWLITRNWWVMIITICRCIAIFKPLRASHILTCRRQVLTFGCVLIPSAVISGLRHPCLFSASIMENMQFCIFDFVIFTVQTGVPVPAVAVTSVIMVLYLMVSPQTNLTRQLCYVRRATRTVLALAVTFAVLESPAFILTIMDTLQVSYPGYLYTISNLCIGVDSAANFVIFLAITRNFKRSLRGLIFRNNRATMDPFLRQRHRGTSNNSPSTGSCGPGGRLGVTRVTSVKVMRSVSGSLDVALIRGRN